LAKAALGFMARTPRTKPIVKHIRKLLGLLIYLLLKRMDYLASNGLIYVESLDIVRYYVSPRNQDNVELYYKQLILLFLFNIFYYESNIIEFNYQSQWVNADLLKIIDCLTEKFRIGGKKLKSMK
jgi:hypothetical protein